ncbi:MULTISPECIES: MalY/PatB family protein [unclassified Enterococcus]|uniref:MalY/PatB family protein n=1 Tax=unclassified Enterococcus TaxID=2608891 RepID=UPI00155350D2|nr:MULTISPECIES: MalY/PatB family protein [unclassified Enterococcus]MBS7576680.1 pyridoxal phosphate-dependent aminotransferase [Enterococcus sp. MMGLQ5-2]MBS7583833.1 pyridoxal phosphate-dependent aminotransferase [Enterococcus sp. MMGLQ5-1]NPD11694.1 pyridoxal phosphate-dependent aminotransferase [Enterococcus sp. MMGLQ5-1]NPD36517.1 pyridoxal phosphate-dependent aminotransferase [Enterococcus sp. MMGLQ5-2]
MKNFEKAVARRGTNSLKWDSVAQDVLPLWVADMDFQTVPEVTAGLTELAKGGVFGYTLNSSQLFQAVIDWQANQHQLKLEKDSIVFIEGVVPAISVALQAFTEPGDAVLINTPVYPPFARTVKLNQRRLIENDLEEINGHFEINFTKLEAQLKDEAVKLYVFCSPHNPGGRVWTAEELEKIGSLCQKYQVKLVSDEIHQDFALFGNQHHPFLTIKPDYQDFSIILGSATKTFNIAGTKNAYAIIPNQDLREKFKNVQLKNNQHEVSSFGQVATELAYQNGETWLAGLKAKIEENIELVTAFTEENLPKVKAMKPEGTYLIWLDFSAYGLDDKALEKKMLREAKVYLNSGISFGQGGSGHLRMNLATSTELVKEALTRIAKVF